MTKLIPLEFQDQKIRTYVNGDIWFCVVDVCRILGYSNSRKAIADHCRKKGVTKRDTLTERGKQGLLYIDEGNLYRLTIKSKKKEAKRFEDWVCDEVLPSIRKTGKYESRQDFRRNEVVSQQEMNFLSQEDIQRLLDRGITHSTQLGYIRGRVEMMQMYLQNTAIQLPRSHKDMLDEQLTGILSAMEDRGALAQIAQ